MLIKDTTTDRLYVIPFGLHGVTLMFYTRKPSTEEFETLLHYELTIEDPPYDPHDRSYSQQEQVFLSAMLEKGDRIGGPPPKRICSFSITLESAKALAVGMDGASLSLKQVSVLHDDQSLYDSLAYISALQTYGSGKESQFKPEQLAKN